MFSLISLNKKIIIVNSNQVLHKCGQNFKKCDHGQIISCHIISQHDNLNFLQQMLNQLSASTLVLLQKSKSDIKIPSITPVIAPAKNQCGNIGFSLNHPDPQSYPATNHNHDSPSTSSNNLTRLSQLYASYSGSENNSLTDSCAVSSPKIISDSILSTPLNVSKYMGKKHQLQESINKNQLKKTNSQEDKHISADNIDNDGASKIIEYQLNDADQFNPKSTSMSHSNEQITLDFMQQPGFDNLDTSLVLTEEQLMNLSIDFIENGNGDNDAVFSSCSYNANPQESPDISFNDRNNNSGPKIALNDDSVQDPDYCPSEESDNESLENPGELSDNENLAELSDNENLGVENVRNSLSKNDFTIINSKIPVLFPDKREIEIKKPSKSIHSVLQTEVVDFQEINRNPIGKVLANRKNLTVPTKLPNTSKKYTCKYCKKKFCSKIAQHFEQVHSDEPEVKEFLRLPKAKKIKNQKLTPDQSLRLSLIAKLKYSGQFQNNIATNDINSMELPRQRSESVGGTELVENLRFCGTCRGLFSKNSIKRHLNQCANISKNSGKQSSAFHEIVLGDFHPLASDYFRIVASKLTNDKISEIAKKDLLIVLYANDEAFKYRSHQMSYKKTRAEMRLLARIFLEFSQKVPEAKELYELIDLKHLNLCIDIVNTIGKFNEVKMIFETSARARDVGRVISQVTETWSLYLGIQKKREERDDVVEFGRQFNKKYEVMVSKTLSESNTTKFIGQRTSKILSIEDVYDFSQFLYVEREAAYESLKSIINKRKTDPDSQVSVSYNLYKRLCYTTLISILVYNRKRPSEISQLRVDAYEAGTEEMTPETHPELFKDMTPFAIEVVTQKYRRIKLRGKKNKKISPVLLDIKIRDCIDLILHVRAEVGISNKNPFVFAQPPGRSDPYMDANTILPRLAEESGISSPELIRGTNLRKQLATAGVSLNLTDNQVKNLSRFMAHNQAVHLDIYRQPVVAKEIFEVAQWLEYAQGGSENMSDMDGLVTRQESECVDSRLSSRNKELETSRPTTSKRSRDRSFDQTELDSIESAELPPSKRPKLNDVVSLSTKEGSKRSYSQAEKDILYDAFLQKFMDGEKVSGAEIMSVINKKGNECLKGRGSADIRSFFQREMRVRKKNKPSTKRKEKQSFETEEPIEMDKKNKRNRISPIIYNRFRNFIMDKKIPSITDCLKEYNTTPQFENYSPQEIQSLVKKAINFDS